MEARLLALPVVVAVVASGCVTSDTAPLQSASLDAALLDPSLAGALAVVRELYRFGDVLVEDPQTGLVYPASLHGSIHYPAEGEGPFPVVLFMHGRHSTCRFEPTGRESLILPGERACVAPVLEPVDSFTGYDYIAEPLAAHGYVVVSVSANDINDRDFLFLPAPGSQPGSIGFRGDAGAHARAQLLVATLDRLAELNASAGPEPIGDGLVGRLDLGRIGLMGHSRGGEGVTYAIGYNAQRTDGPVHAIRAVFALAPIDVTRVTAPDTAFAVLLPYCDGDVSTLVGAWIYDDSRYLEEARPSPKHQLLAMGANHNYYNTVWTSDDGDYGDDAYCRAAEGPGAPQGGRLAPEEQRAHGLAAIAGFFRHHLGGEPALGPWLRGEAPAPASACPGAMPPCDHLLRWSHHPTAPARRVLEDTLDEAALERNDLGGAARFESLRAVWCEPQDCPAASAHTAAPQLALAWEGPARYVPEVPPGHGDVRGFSAFSFRAAVAPADHRNPPGQPQDLRVVLTDAGGRSASAVVGAHGDALFYPPGSPSDPGTSPLGFGVFQSGGSFGSQKVTLNMARVPLAAFAGVDLAQVRSVELVFDQTPRGAIQVTDLLFQA